MAMEIGAATAGGQLTATRTPDRKDPIEEAFAEFEMTDKLQVKTEQDDQQRLMLAEHTGKGLNINITA